MRRTYTFRRQEILEHPTATADLFTIYPPLMDPEEVRHVYMNVHIAQVAIYVYNFYMILCT